MQSTRRGSFPVHRSEKTPGSKYSSTSGLSPRDRKSTRLNSSHQLISYAVFCLKKKKKKKKLFFFFFNDTATTEIYTLSLHDALPICASFGKNPRFQIQLDKRPLSPGTSREAGGVPCLDPRRGLTLLSPVCRDPAIGV